MGCAAQLIAYHITFALYLQHIGETNKFNAAVEEAYNAIAWVHTASTSSSSTSNALVKATLEGLHRYLVKKAAW